MISSAPANGFPENIVIQPVVVPELEFRHIRREIFAAGFVIAAHHTALYQAPEAFDRVRVQRTNLIPIATMDNRAVVVFALQISVASVKSGIIAVTKIVLALFFAPGEGARHFFETGRS